MCWCCRSYERRNVVSRLCALAAQSSLIALCAFCSAKAGDRHDQRCRVLADVPVGRIDLRVWSELSPSGGPVFRYVADVHGFIGDEPFESNHVEGTIPRRWV